MAFSLPTAGAGGPNRILIVDDDAAMRDWLCATLGTAGYDTVAVADGAHALIHLWAQAYPVILLDQNLPGLSGLELLPSLRTVCPDTAVVVITGNDSGDLYQEALEKGVFDLLQKPLSMSLLIRTVQSAVHFSRTLGPRQRQHSSA